MRRVSGRAAMLRVAAVLSTVLRRVPWSTAGLWVLRWCRTVGWRRRRGITPSIRLLRVMLAVGLALRRCLSTHNNTVSTTACGTCCVRGQVHVPRRKGTRSRRGSGC